jgi:DNA-binding CsgD family transcriptional regulator
MDALLAEPSSPLRDSLTRLIQAPRDLGVGHPVGRVQDRLRANNIAMRPRVRRRATLKLAPLLSAQDHLIWRPARHHPQDSPPSQTLLQPSAAYLRRRPLSDREREVLALVAEGLSDPEIAERLLISPHTVHRHVANIRAKLNQPSRAGAAATGARLGLI